MIITRISQGGKEMPKYDFICPDGHTKEVNCKVSEYDSEQYCEEKFECVCGAQEQCYCDNSMDRVYSTFGIVMH